MRAEQPLRITPRCLPEDAAVPPESSATKHEFMTPAKARRGQWIAKLLRAISLVWFVILILVIASVVREAVGKFGFWDTIKGVRPFSRFAFESVLFSLPCTGLHLLANKLGGSDGRLATTSAFAAYSVLVAWAAILIVWWIVFKISSEIVGLALGCGTFVLFMVGLGIYTLFKKRAAT